MAFEIHLPGEIKLGGSSEACKVSQQSTMAFVAQYSVTVSSLDQQVEAWLLSWLLSFLFLMILIKALSALPLFYAGPLLMVVALTLRKRLATPLRTAHQKATLKIEDKRKKEGDRRIHFVGSMPSFIIFVGAAAVIFEIVRVSPKAATDAYNTVQEFTDPKHGEGDPLSIEQRAIVERYLATYSKIQLLSLDQDERFVATQIAKHKRDRRWLSVQAVLQHFAHVYAPKPSRKQISQHFFALWRRLEEEAKTGAAENPSPTPQ
jgi:hypothetical protein